MTVATPHDHDAVAEQIARRIPLVHFPARLPLHDWANWPEALPIDERWTFLRSHTRELRDWRQHFSKWLAVCYDDPWRYLQSDEDLLLAGLPERSDPPEIRDHNGPAGAHQYSGHCGDRRAWTWEVRFHQRLPWRAHVRLLHVTVAALERANDVADEIERMTGKRPDVRALPHEVMADFDAFFEASGPILRECIET